PLPSPTGRSARAAATRAGTARPAITPTCGTAATEDASGAVASATRGATAGRARSRARAHGARAPPADAPLADARRGENLAAREDDAVLAPGLDEAALELLRVQLRVETAAAEELLVRPLLDEAAAVDDEDHVGGEDRREPVRDRDRRPALHQGLERVLDEPLARRVQSGRRLVE